MKLIKTEDAVGSVLCHDLTQIIKGVTKDAVLETGLKIRVPGFIKQGEKVRVNTETREYLERVND